MTQITVEFLQELLKDDYPDVTIQQFQVSPGSKRGDNYASVINRITMKGIRKNKEPDGSIQNMAPWESSIICKCLPDSITVRELYKSEELFYREAAFYNNIWPTMLKFQSQWDNVKRPFKNIPKCYLARMDCVVLEDLKRQGFVMVDRKQCLTIEQSYTVLKLLAQFHALSIAMKNHNPKEFCELLNNNDDLSEVYFIKKNKDCYKMYYQETFRNVIAMVEYELKDSENKDLYINKFKQFCCEDTFFEKMMELVTPKEPLAAISHGDCWMNNLLFRHDIGDMGMPYLLDFQVVRYAPPTLDLIYIIYLCMSRQQRSEHMSSLLEYYTDELHKRLVELSEEDSVFNSSLNREVMSKLIQDEFKNSVLFGLGNALDMFPMLTCDSNEATNINESEDQASESNVLLPVWTSDETCRRRMTELLVELVDGGAL